MLGKIFEMLSTIRFRFVRMLIGKMNVPQTLSIQLDLTHACNLRCTHCYHDKHLRTNEMSYDQWMQVLDKYDALRVRLGKEPAILFCGGEPLLSEHFFPMLDVVRTRWPECSIAILSNGTIIGPQLFEGKNLDGVRFQISFDGVDAATHDCVRGEGSFERSVAGVRYLRLRSVPFSFQAVLSKRTAKFIPSFFALAKALGATEMNFTRMVAVGNAAELMARDTDGPIEGEALRSALLAILDSSRTIGVLTNTAKPLFNLIDPSLGAPQYIGFQGIVVDPSGNLKVSSRTPTVLGNVLSEGLEKTFLSHEVMVGLRAGKIDGCASCTHFRKCGGDRNVAFAKTGSYFTKDPGCWL